MDNGGPAPGTEFKPGDTVTPGQQAPTSAASPAPVAPAPVAEPATSAPTTQGDTSQAPQPAPPTAPEPIASPQPQPEQQPQIEGPAAASSPYAFAAEQPGFEPEPAPTPGSDRTVTWVAPEFIAHQKDFGWYAVLALGAIIVAAAVQLVFKDVFSTAVVLVVALLFGAYGAREPRDIQITLDMHGITLGNKTRDYNEFRSFSIAHDGPLPSIVLAPLKRFGMLVTIYYNIEQENDIAEELSLHLPYVEHKTDPIDALMHRLRF